MTTLVYLSSIDRFEVRNHDKKARVTGAQLTALGADVVALSDVAKRNPDKPVHVPGARDPRPRHSRIYSHILQ
jgi:hypothetical protein